jgi:hypothetical protein
MARQLTAPSQPTYTGAWRSTSAYSDVRRTLAPGVDPSHLYPDEPDPGQVAAGYPRVDLPPTYITEDADTDYRDALDTPGLVLDTEPITHDAGDYDIVQPSPGYGGAGANFAPSAIPHAIARGREMVGQHEEPQMRAADEQPRTERWQNLPVSRGNTLSALRGDNSLPENNPEGFPTGPGEHGYLVKRYYHRLMPWEQFKHTERWLHNVTAARAVESPAFTPAESNRYTSPFAWRSFYAGALLQGPLMRRQPPDAWADQQSDGTDLASDPSSLWTAD